MKHVSGFRDLVVRWTKFLRVSHVSVGNANSIPRSGEIWERERLAYFVSSKEYREIFDIAREPVVFEWRICPGHTTGQLFEEVQKMVDENKVHPFHVKERIIFMSMFSDLDWTHKHNEEQCRPQNSSRVSAFAELGAGHFSALQMKKSGTGPLSCQPEGNRSNTAQIVTE